MRKYLYSLPTSSAFYASFDYGHVWASNPLEARAKAIEKINYDVAKVNSVLAHSDNTCGFTIEYCTDELAIEETEENLLELVIDQIKRDIECNDFSDIESLINAIGKTADGFGLIKEYLIANNYSI